MKNIKNKKREKKPFLSTFSKVIVFLSLIYGWILTTVSYIWAYKGYQPLTDLSSTIVSTIVSPTITYLLSNAFMTVFEKNQLAFSTPIAAIQSGVVTPQNTTQTSTSTSISPDNPLDLDEIDNFEFATSSGLGDDEIQ